MTTSTSVSKTFSPWPYAIIGFFVLFVSSIAVFVGWAVRQDMDLVRADYYDHEILFQQQIDRQKRTAELGPQVAVNFDAERQSITVAIPAAHATGANGTIHFYRPSDARLDHEVRLAPDAAGVQQVDTKNLRTGLWRVAAEWIADGKSYYLERQVVIGN